jgi:hypothetical protein
MQGRAARAGAASRVRCHAGAHRPALPPSQAMQVRGEQAVPRGDDAVGGAPWGFEGPLVELPETGMAELGRLCRAAGADDLFAALLKL